MILLILLFILLTSIAEAQDFTDQVTLTRTISGSHIVQYGGLHELASREMSRYLVNEWDEWSDKLYTSGQINTFGHLRRWRWLREELDDIRNGGKWWVRKNWWDNLEPSNGGAPKRAIVTNIGRTHKIINTPIFFLTNSGRFRWKQFRATVDLKNKNFSLGDKKNWSGVGWKLGFRPRIRFTSTGRSVIDLIRMVGCDVVLSHWVRGRNIIDLWISTRYQSQDSEVVVEAQMSFVQW